MPYEVKTTVYEGPFDLLLHLILPRAGRPLRDLAVAHRRRLPRRAREDGDARPRDHHRVPADRRHAGRAEVQAAAARGRRRRPRRRVRPLGGARPPHRPPPRLQDLQGRRPGARRTRRVRLTLLPPHRRARGAVPRTGSRPARGHRRRRPARRVPAGHDTSAQTRRQHRAHPPGPGERAGRRRGSSTSYRAWAGSRSAASPRSSSSASRS